MAEGPLGFPRLTDIGPFVSGEEEDSHICEEIVDRYEDQLVDKYEESVREGHELGSQVAFKDGRPLMGPWKSGEGMEIDFRQFEFKDQPPFENFGFIHTHPERPFMFSPNDLSQFSIFANRHDKFNFAGVIGEGFESEDIFFFGLELGDVGGGYADLQDEAIELHRKQEGLETWEEYVRWIKELDELVNEFGSTCTIKL